MLRTDSVLVLSDPAADRRFRPDVALRERSPHALLGLPVGRATGTRVVLVFETDGAGSAFDPDRVEALRVLSAQAISAIDHARLTSDLSTLSEDVTDVRSTAESLTARAETDPLTGVANRLGLESRLHELMRGGDGRSPGVEVGVLFCDLDDFKPINDTWGHAAGDQALVEVAERLRAAVRDGDVVARVGGDEFVVVAVGVSEAELEATAARALRSVIGPIEVVGVGAMSVSMSIGVGRAQLPEGATIDDLDALVDRADHAMYRAKRAGKNRVDHG